MRFLFVYLLSTNIKLQEKLQACSDFKKKLWNIIQYIILLNSEKKLNWISLSRYKFTFLENSIV